MKIFSLQSKTGLVVWSVALGILVNIVLYSIYFMLSFRCLDVMDAVICMKPFNAIFFWLRYGDYTGFLFWILTSFIILFTIRHFRKKNYQLPSKLA